MYSALLASVRARRVQRRGEAVCGLRMQVRMKAGVKSFAIAAFLGYLAWNVVWLLRGRIPPSIWTYCTGLPCPTSGVCRSLLALSRGDFIAAFFFNTFTLPYLLLISLSAAELLRQSVRRRELALPPLLARAWCFALCFGWLAKFVVGSNYW
jgi:hypothetical protein